MNREERHAEIDRRSDAMRDQIEQGDWQLLEQILASAPEAQRREFYTACGQLLLGTGAEFMRSALAVLAEPLQDAVALGIAERVEKEIAEQTPPVVAVMHPKDAQRKCHHPTCWNCDGTGYSHRLKNTICTTNNEIPF